MQKIFIIIGIVILIIGLFYPHLKKLGLGKLPGDIILKGENSSFYFPIITCIVISIILSLIINFLR